ncbi:hypothetical protein PR048_017993 [Dryococelus australis]|uniref:Uncharacterized protein n=1 Tax=Dryococelus australis TaxID=614101 RepID=A0ABQ9HBE4_9NEOP|nr:hypothetical protein PR048_017993 [Dryococelus australis]
MLYWAVENPSWLRQVDHQRQWRINVWCEMVGNKVIGLYFVNGNRNGREHATFKQFFLDGAALEFQGRGKWEYPEKTRRQAASSSTIPTCENPGAIPPGIEPGSPWWEANALATAPPLPLIFH